MGSGQSSDAHEAAPPPFPCESGQLFDGAKCRHPAVDPFVACEKGDLWGGAGAGCVRACTAGYALVDGECQRTCALGEVVTASGCAATKCDAGYEWSSEELGCVLSAASKDLSRMCGPDGATRALSISGGAERCLSPVRLWPLGTGDAFRLATSVYEPPLYSNRVWIKLPLPDPVD